MDNLIVWTFLKTRCKFFSRYAHRIRNLLWCTVYLISFIPACKIVTLGRFCIHTYGFIILCLVIICPVFSTNLQYCCTILLWCNKLYNSTFCTLHITFLIQTFVFRNNILSVFPLCNKFKSCRILYFNGLCVSLWIIVFNRELSFRISLHRIRIFNYVFFGNQYFFLCMRYEPPSFKICISISRQLFVPWIFPWYWHKSVGVTSVKRCIILILISYPASAIGLIDHHRFFRKNKSYCSSSGNTVIIRESILFIKFILNYSRQYKRAQNLP